MERSGERKERERRGLNLGRKEVRRPVRVNNELWGGKEGGIMKIIMISVMNV